MSVFFGRVGVAKTMRASPRSSWAEEEAVRKEGLDDRKIERKMVLITYTGASD